MKTLNHLFEKGILTGLLSLVCAVVGYFVVQAFTLIASLIVGNFYLYDFLFYNGFWVVLFLTASFLVVYLLLHFVADLCISALCRKLGAAIRNLFGWGILVSLFAGGLTFFGYLVALIVGGETAGEICRVIHKEIFPIIIYLSTVMVLLGLVAMYFGGQKALTSHKEEGAKHEGEL